MTTNKVSKLSKTVEFLLGSSNPFGFCVFCRYFCREPHTFSVGFKSGLSGGVHHQLMLLVAKTFLGIVSRMFQVIILLESMTIDNRDYVTRIGNILT